MFQHAYQNGSHLEIFDPKGLKQNEKINDKLFKISNTNFVSKSYDKSLKSYLYEVLPGTKATLQFPKDDRQELGLLQHYLVLQIFLGIDSTFSLELVLSDTTNHKRRLIFTNSVKEIEKTHFHIKIPLDHIKRNTWMNLSFDLLSYFEMFPSSTFRSLESFIISGNYKLRKIFTMRDPLIESSSLNDDSNFTSLNNQKTQGIISKALNFGPGAIYENQLVFYKGVTTQPREYSTPMKPPRDSKQSTQNMSSYLNTPTNINLISFMGRTGKKIEDSFDVSSKLKSNNTSRFMDTSKSPMRHRSKENSIVSLTHINDHAKSSLASTADSQKCLANLKLTSPMNNIKPRMFFSPRNEFQFPAPPQVINPIKEDLSMRLSTDEPRVGAKSILLDSKKTTIRITPKSKDDKLNRQVLPQDPPKKSKSTVRINKLQEIIELNEKASLYNRRMNQKKPMASYLLPNLSSPKMGTIVPELQSTTSIRSPNANNPWINNHSELSFPFNKNSMTSKFGMRTPRGTNEKPVIPVKIELKPVRAKESFDNKSNKGSSKGSIGMSRKEIITTAATTPKDNMMSESDRFSILSRSGDEYGIRNRNREILMSRDEYKDEIESIEENLEYEINSNTSGIRRSQILNEDEVNSQEISKDIFDAESPEKSYSPDLYQPFIKREQGEEASIESVVYHKGGRRGKNLSRIEYGNSKRIAQQFEDKMMDIVSNTRPYSPPFQSKANLSQKPAWIKRESISNLNLQKAAMILRTEQESMEKDDCYERALKTDRYLPC